MCKAPFLSVFHSSLLLKNNSPTNVLTCRFILDLFEASASRAETRHHRDSRIGDSRGLASTVVYLTTFQLGTDSSTSTGDMYDAVVGWDRAPWDDEDAVDSDVLELRDRC